MWIRRVSQLVAAACVAVTPTLVAHADAADKEACNRLKNPNFDYSAQLKDAKGDTRHSKATDADQCYIEHRLPNALFGSMHFTADGGLSNGVFDSSSIDQRHVSELDESSFQYGIKIGYAQRPVIRDAWLLTGNAERVAAYRKKKGSFYRWGFMDAVTMKAEVGWGTTIEPDDRKERFTTSEDLIFEVGLQYSLPLENLGFPLSEP